MDYHRRELPTGKSRRFLFLCHTSHRNHAQLEHAPAGPATAVTASSMPKRDNSSARPIPAPAQPGAAMAVVGSAPAPPSSRPTKPVLSAAPQPSKWTTSSLWLKAVRTSGITCKRCAPHTTARRRLWLTVASGTPEEGGGESLETFCRPGGVVSRTHPRNELNL